MDAVELNDLKVRLIKKAIECGVEGLHMEMGLEEIKKVYRDWKASQNKKDADNAKLPNIKSLREQYETKKRVVIAKGRMLLPNDFREIYEDEISRERIEDKELVVFFKQGAKVRYCMRTYKRII